MTLLTVVFAPLFMALFAAAAPLSGQVLAKKDVFVPRIIEPNSSTVWKSGQTFNVTWDTSDAPAQITNRFGKVLIGFGTISTPVLLANGFDILDGSVAVKVPLVETNDNWNIVLMGDSGNFSPPFTIIGVDP
ncbi:hypothetical protein EIP91_000934 [Steccherinum ochraceum]|uniref:Uncharacterized protein n=1 Tax=Steccherinum ochraceum TaxID=92696 RepID=A0A4R0RSM3_9APHY|nr:hypothetical protein EIP91_000934 [Steccherinum ochraceum]